MGDNSTKHHSPHLPREICDTYLYMTNALLKINHKFMQEWENSILAPNHTVVITPNHTVVQGFANVVRTYEHIKPTTVP